LPSATTARSARRATVRQTWACDAPRVPAGRMNSCSRGSCSLCRQRLVQRQHRLGLEQLEARNRQLAAQVEQLVLDLHQQLAHASGMGSHSSRPMCELSSSTSPMACTRRLFLDAGVVAQAGGAVVAGAGGDLRESVSHVMQISWRKSFECGHPVIDRQHRELFEIGDGVIKAVLKNKSRDHIEFLLDELTEHIQNHFVTEEAAMARTRFPLSGEHRAQHAELLEKARGLRDRYRSGLLDISELVGFIAYDVISEHIINQDLKFALRKNQPLAA
jgi:hemerythrin-like metal-binding protein